MNDKELTMTHTEAQALGGIHVILDIMGSMDADAVISLMRDSNGTLPAVTVMDASLDPINIKSTLEGILSELVVSKQ